MTLGIFSPKMTSQKPLRIMTNTVFFSMSFSGETTRVDVESRKGVKERKKKGKKSESTFQIIQLRDLKTSSETEVETTSATATATSGNS